MTELKQEWINTAIEVLDKAHVPYSHSPVDACLVMKSGRIYQGISIENMSFGLTNCAEHTTLLKAVSGGEKIFTHLVVAGHTPDPTFPCGACQQVVIEFCSPGMSVTLVGDNSVTKATTVRVLLSYAFTEKGL